MLEENSSYMIKIIISISYLQLFCFSSISLSSQFFFTVNAIAETSIAPTSASNKLAPIIVRNKNIFFFVINVYNGNNNGEEVRLVSQVHNNTWNTNPFLTDL